MKIITVKTLLALVAIMTLSGCANSSSSLSSSSSTLESGESSSSSILPVRQDYPILNASFEQDLGTALDYEWDNYNYDATYTYSNDKTEGTHSLETTSVIGGYLSVWQAMPIENQAYAAKFDNQFNAQKDLAAINGGRLPKNGDKVEFSIDIKVDGTNPPLDLSLLKIYVKVENSKKVPTIIAEANVTEIILDQWFTLSVQATNNGGVIPDDSVIVVLALNIDIPEGVILRFDNAQARTYTENNSTVSSSSGSSEEVPQGYDAFDDAGQVMAVPNNSFETGTVPFKISGLAAPTYADGYYGNKSMLVADGSKATYTSVFPLQDVKAKTLAAGIWVYIDSDNIDAKAKLSLRAKIDGTYQNASSIETTILKRWVYLKTPLMDYEKSKLYITNIEVAAEALGATCYFDFVQIGDYQRFNGNPQKFAIMAYQPWFRATNNSWGNWMYDSSAYGGRLYNPSVITGTGADQKRDIASVYYPTIGAYDSTDIEVLRYHVSLIKAMNIDAIQVNYYAGLASAAYQLDVLNKLFIIGEEVGMKISILYEPKIHLNGWIPHSSRDQSLIAIATDITTFVNQYKDSKALLQYNGQPMIEIFGLNSVTGPEWGNIIASVNAQTGFTVPLMGDGVSSGDYTNITSMFQWNLYKSTLASGTSGDCVAHNLEINNKVLDWAAANVGVKQAVGLVYPGFNDTPVRSWSTAANAPIRNIARTGPDFYNDSWAAFNQLKDRFDWLIVATFNDWTEGTIIEPTRENGHLLAYKTAVEIASFKGLIPDTIATLEAITNTYLSTRTTSYI